MAQGDKTSSIKGILARLFGSSRRTEKPIVQQEEISELADQPEPALSEPLPEAELSPAAYSISEKLAVLKKTLDFDQDVKARLEGVTTGHELLLCVHEVFLHRFARLRDIGLITSQSSQTLDFFDDKLTRVLSGQNTAEAAEAAGAADTSLNAGELQKENAELKKEIQSLHARYVKEGVITETEVSLRKEIKYLESKARERGVQLKIARKRLEVLASSQEMIKSLRARNSLLTSKTESQARILRSMTASNPKHKDLASTVRKLSDENRQLKVDLDRQSELLGRLRNHIPADAYATVEGLVTRNRDLQRASEDRETQLDGLTPDSEADLLGYVERLNERNFELKKMVETRSAIDGFLGSYQEGKGSPDQVIEALNAENENMQAALDAKDERIKTLAGDPSVRKLLKAHIELQREHREVLKEIENRERLYQEEVSEKQILMAQLRERNALVSENQQLKRKLEAGRNLIEAFNKSEYQRKLLKKERAEISSKYDRACVELEREQRKVAKLTAEYNLLMKEYENIFGGR